MYELNVSIYLQEACMFFFLIYKFDFNLSFQSLKAFIRQFYYAKTLN